MRSFMSPGKRIRSFRLKRGMTQRALGRAVGFPAETADIRIAQYESRRKNTQARFALCICPDIGGSGVGAGSSVYQEP